MDPELDADREVLETLGGDIEVIEFEVAAVALPLLLMIRLDALGVDVGEPAVLEDAVEPVVVGVGEVEGIEVARP